jgi:4-hydroxy-tetrahydrodipicolinate synthase
MQQNNEHTSSSSSSRRSFLGKIAAGGMGMAFTAGLGSKVHAAKNAFTPGAKQPGAPFESGKKFVPVMVTPYKQNGQIDFDGVSRLVDFYTAAGVKGFFANCASSEMYKLTPDERLNLTRHVVKRVNGAVPVVATGSFGNTLEEKAEFAKKIYHTGINAVIMITSHFATEQESDDVLIKNFEQFFTLTDNIPMGTYECPSPYKRIITPYVFKYLLDSGRMVYHKDTTIDLEKVKAKIAMVKNNRLEFYDACVANTMYSLQAGAKGMSAIAGNFYPDILAWMCANSTNPERQEDVKYIQAQLTVTEDIVGQNYPLSAKYFLRKRGVPIEVLSRTNTSPLTAQQMKTLDDTYNVVMGWCKRIGLEPARLS